MVSRSVFIAIAILMMATMSFGQGFTVVLNSVEQVLTADCGSGDPLPDGAIVLIYHDNVMSPGQPGPDSTDFQPVVGNLDGDVNFNSFPINGNIVSGEPGTFQIGPIPFSAWISYGIVPTPNFFYLVVCHEDVKYYSGTFIVSPNYQEIDFGPSGVPWNCLDESCGLQLPPPPPLNSAASTGLCNGIEVTWTMDWEYLGGDICGWLIYRGTAQTAEIIDTVWFQTMPEPPFSYLDETAAVGPNSYFVAALRCFGGEEADTLASRRCYVANGSRLPGPPVPTLYYVSNNLCETVQCSLSVATVAGLDEVRVYRVGNPDDVLIGSRSNVLAGNRFNIFDEDPPEGPHMYYAVSWSEICGNGTHSAELEGEALFPPLGTVTITEVNETCDAICITWSYEGGDDVTGFRVRKNTTDLIDLGPNVFEYCDETAVPGVQTGYRVIAFNGCDIGDPSTPVIGTRLDVPDAPTGFTATTDGCSCVELAWTDPAGDDLVSLGIYRDATLIGTVNPGDMSYSDCDVVYGTDYTYYVTATNGCGEGDHSATRTGSLGNPNGGTATLALTTAGPPSWDYSLTWASGCVSTLIIRDLCDGTTASYEGTGDWTATLYDEGDSVVFHTETPLGEGVANGFRLTNSTGCSGTGTWTAGSDGGTIEGPLPIIGGPELPTDYSVAVYPNPFNPSTSLEFALPKAGHVNVTVYDVNGRQVREVVSEAFNAGYHAVSFDGTGLPSGLYFARISADNFVATKKLMLLK